MSLATIVKGNTFSLAIPLQVYAVEDGEVVLRDYTPESGDAITIRLKGDRRNYTYIPSTNGSTAFIHLEGSEVVGVYAVEVEIVKDDDSKLTSMRFEQLNIVDSIDELNEGQITGGIEQGAIYLDPEIFIAGEDGRGIVSIVKTATAGLVDTYTITYSDNTTSTFNVTNGAAGAQGADGVGITSIEKTATVGLVDTYTITLSNGETSTFDVTNGKDGVDLGLATIVNDLTTGGATDVLSAEMGKELGDVLVNETKDLTSQMKAGYVMSGTANAGQTITLTKTANANGHYIILDVVAGDKVWLKGKGYAGNRQYIFMDDNNVVKEIAAWNKTADTDWTEYTTPNDATKLIVNSIDASNYGVKIQNTPMTTRVANLESGMADIYTPLQLVGVYNSTDSTAGYVAQGNVGAVVAIAANSSKRYVKIGCSKGDKFRINTIPNGTASYIVTDSNEVILYKGSGPFTPVDVTIEITRDDAAHIYVNSALYDLLVQKYSKPTQGAFNEGVGAVTSALDMIDAENLYDGEVEYGTFGGLTGGMWTSPISVEEGEGYTCYMIMGTNKRVGFWNGDTYVSNRTIQNGVNHISVPSGCNAMRFYNMDSKRSKECYVVKGSVDITHALRKKAAGYIDEFDLVQLTNKINLPLADKNIAILGDSITNVGYYPTEFFRITGYKNKAVYGRDGAAWTNDEYHTDNNIKERIDALENGITWTPDIIIVALGRNDNGRSPIGDIAEAMFATQETLNERATMYNAIRYGVKRLRSLYPNAKIFLQGIQWSKIIVGVTNTVEKYRVQEEYVLQYNEVIRNAADHMGCSFINVFADGVCEDTADRYLSDGLHDNAAGGVVHGRCVAAAVLAAFKD